MSNTTTFKQRIIDLLKKYNWHLVAMYFDNNGVFPKDFRFEVGRAIVAFMDNTGAFTFCRHHVESDWIAARKRVAENRAHGKELAKLRTMMAQWNCAGKILMPSKS